MAELLRRIPPLFVLWVLTFSLLAYLLPDGFRWFRPFIVPGLGVIMLGMGLTLRPSDFVRVVKAWRGVAVGVAAQFGLMPAAAFATAHVLDLPPEIGVGLLLVASCPGGTASNVIVYLAGADVALSITLTATSTLLSPVVTPMLLNAYAGAAVEVSLASQALQIARIVILPVVAGLVLRLGLERAGRTAAVGQLLAIFPSVSVLLIVLIVACIVALSADRIAALGAGVVSAVVILNGFGLLGGYVLARLLRLDIVAARTVAIEVGMQNSGLGVALAHQFFTPLTALPSAFFSLWHNVTGPALASYWRSRPGRAR